MKRQSSVLKNSNELFKFFFIYFRLGGAGGMG